MSKNSQQVMQWRQRTKIKLITAMGGKCRVCGYNRCNSALEFHHINPSEKEFSYGDFQSKSIEKIIAELKKCILLCAICHREYHAGLIELQGILPILDETLIKDSRIRTRKVKNCPICNSETKNRKFCSNKCSKINQERINWSEYDLLEMNKTMSKRKIAQFLGVSDVSVKKRINKLLDNPVRK